MPRRLNASEMFTAIGWSIAALSLGILISSLFISTNLAIRLATIAFCALAVLRPADALLVAAAFVGFGDVVGHLSGVPTLRAGEAIVAVALFGWSLHAVPVRSRVQLALRGINAVPVMLFGLTAACSALVWMRVDQAQTAYPAIYLADLWRTMSRHYFVDVNQFLDVASTVALVESLALYLAIASMCRVDRTFFERALRMLVVGAAGIAALSIVRVAEIMLRNANAIGMLRATYSGLRISPQIPDYIAAAAYFGLCWTAAVGLALQRSRARAFILVVAVVLLAGLFLTGSRSAIGAAAGGICALAYLVVWRTSAIRPRWVIGVAALAIVVFAVAFPKLIGHDVVGTTAGESLKMRIELVKAGAAVLDTHPLFGVGLDRFFLYVDRFASPQLNAMWTGRKNPHNDFLRVATELGLSGLLLFGWILAGCASRISRGWGGRGDARLAGLVGGLTAFSMTMLLSNPLMVHSVSYAFWIALGLATGQATATAPGVEQSGTLARPRQVRKNVLVALASLVLLASVPLRAAREVGSMNLAGVTYGLTDWSMASDGVPSRLSGARATLFVESDARSVEIPLRGTLPAGGVQTVKVFVDGRLANELPVGRERQRVRIPFVSDTSRVRRIDLRVDPTWTPADAGGASSDHRRFGVEVGELYVVRSTIPRR